MRLLEKYLINFKKEVLAVRLLIGRIIKWLGKNEILNFINDEIYLKILFYFFMNKSLDLSNPQTLNEKIQWIKLYMRDARYVSLVDKVTAKDYVAKVIGEKYIIPTLGIWDDFEKIDFKNLPEKFVLKCNHDSGSCIVCKNKTKLDIGYARKFLKKKLNRNYYWAAREWFYKGINPKIIAESYMEDSSTNDLRDYKFYCFNGRVDSVLLCLGRNIGKPVFYFFDKEWNLKRYNLSGKEAPDDFFIDKPKNIEEMFFVAEKLAKSIKVPFVRIDLYSVNSKTYFGEFTFYPDSGMDRNRLPETDKYFGSLFELKNSLESRRF